MKTKLESILLDLYRAGKIDTHEVAAIIGACECASNDNNGEQFRVEYGTFAQEGLDSLLSVIADL